MMEQHIETPVIETPLTLEMGCEDYFVGARKFAEANYGETITRISNTKFENLHHISFFDEYVWCVYVSGFRASTISKIWNRLMDRYLDLDLCSESVLHDDQEIKRNAMAIFANERKVDAVIKCSHIVRDNIRTIGWERFRNECLSTPEKLQELPFIGKITCYHLARNIGLLQYVKPDVHLERMAKHWQYKSPQNMCEHLGKLNGLEPGIVDLILWYAASTFGTRDIGTNKEIHQ
jgi:endonuclease III